MVFILALAAIVLLVIGIALIFKSYSDIPDPQQVVPASEAVKLQTDLDSSHLEEEKFKQKLDVLVVELEKSKSQLTQAAANGQETVALKKEIEGYEGKIQELVHSLEYLRIKAEQQAQDAVEVLTALQTQNEDLKVAVQARVDPAALTQLQDEKKNLEDKIQANLSQVKAMEQELAVAHNQGVEKLTAAESSVTRLTAEKQKLQDEFSQVTNKIQELETALVKANQEKEQELHLAQAAVEDLKAAMENLNQDKAANETQVQALQSELERIKAKPVVALQAPAASSGWEQEKSALEKGLKDLKDAHTRLQAREKLLQSELTKSRAQAIGLERICVEFKNQLNQSKRVS